MARPDPEKPLRLNSITWLAPIAVGVALSVALGLAAPLQAQEAWLVTYGPGAAVEERFGHNALWVRDEAAGIDRIYNFGFFDFDQPGFYADYAFGRMIYFAAAHRPEAEFDHYRSRDRSIFLQRLNLTDARIDELFMSLEFHVHPEHRDFRYDYYFNNCSNRVRDVLDEVLGGKLAAATRDRPAGQDFRAHTRRLTEEQFVLYLGIHAGLGRAVDQPRTVWEEMFLPEVVAREAGRIEIDTPRGREPLVIDEQMMYRSRQFSPPAEPGIAAGLFGGLGAATAAVLLLPVLFSRRRGRPGWLALLPLRLWIGLCVAAGAMLLFLWLLTEHQAAWRNENLLLFNPLLAGLWSTRAGRIGRWCAALVAAGLVAALLLKLLPGAQWNYDLLLWLIPAQAAALGAWWAARR